MNIYNHQVFNDVKIIDNFCSRDLRGGFVKIFTHDAFKAEGIDFLPAETYYSVSNKNTIRGMHFQIPPYDHSKLIHVLCGNVVDVLLDLRKDSITYGQVSDIFLSADKSQSVFIPQGFAHGFRCLADNTVMLYQCSTVYSPEHDRGIRYDSIPYDWNISDPIVSDRDRAFPLLSDFDTPFN